MEHEKIPDAFVFGNFFMPFYEICILCAILISAIFVCCFFVSEFLFLCLHIHLVFCPQALILRIDGLNDFLIPCDIVRMKNLDEILVALF